MIKKEKSKSIDNNLKERTKKDSLKKLNNLEEINKEYEKNKFIDADLLTQQLKEEAEDNKILLHQLNGRKKINRDYIKELEQEKLIKERYNTKNKLMEKKRNDEYMRMVNVIKNPINIKRTNKIEKKLNNNLREYNNDKKNNLKLNLNYKIYFDSIKNLDNDKFKKQAEDKYIKLQNENKMKIKERQKNEEKRKKQLLKIEKDNEKYKLLVKNNFQMSKDDININKKSNNTNLLFQEEKNIEGTNLSPDMLNKNEQ